MGPDSPPRLRPFRDSDEERLLLWRNNPEISRWMYTDHWIDLDEHHRWFGWAAVDTSDHRFRILEIDGLPSGMTSLTRIDASHRSCYFGCYVDPDNGGRGLGKAALALSLSLAFDDLGLNRVVIETLSDNDRTIRLHKRFGFIREATFREMIWKDGRPHDVVGMAMLRSDWVANRSAIVKQAPLRGTR